MGIAVEGRKSMIAIKGMDMPRGCDDCPLLYQDECVLMGIPIYDRYGYIIEPKTDRLSDCPLVGIEDE